MNVPVVMRGIYRYQRTGWSIEEWQFDSLQGQEIFPFHNVYMSAVGSPQPDQRVPMSLSPDISRPDCDFDDSPLSVVDFKTVMSCTSTPPYVLVSCCKRYLYLKRCYILMLQSLSQNNSSSAQVQSHFYSAILTHRNSGRCRSTWNIYSNFDVGFVKGKHTVLGFSSSNSTRWGSLYTWKTYLLFTRMFSHLLSTASLCIIHEEKRTSTS